MGLKDGDILEKIFSKLNKIKTKGLLSENELNKLKNEINSAFSSNSNVEIIENKVFELIDNSSIKSLTFDICKLFQGLKSNPKINNSSKTLKRKKTKGSKKDEEVYVKAYSYQPRVVKELEKKSDEQVRKDKIKSEKKQKRQRRKVLHSEVCLLKTSTGKIDVESVKNVITSNIGIFTDIVPIYKVKKILSA